MVIPPSCPGVNIEVLVHGHPVQEYDDVDRGPVPPNTVTKYIEAPSDTEFAIRLKVTDAFLFPPSDMELGTSIDRDIVVRSLFRSSNLFSAQGCIVEGRACGIGYVSDALQKFRFTPLHVDEGHQLRINDSVRKDLESAGLITVTLRFIRNVRRALQVETPAYKDSRAFPIVSEEALKEHFKTHHTSLSPSIPAEGYWLDCDYVGNEAFVTVHFKYRSLDGLRALQIVPPPIPLEERPVEDLSHTELQEVVNKLKRDLANRRVKPEPNVTAESIAQNLIEDDDVVVVEQHDRKRRRGQAKEVIVLD